MPHRNMKPRRNKKGNSLINAAIILISLTAFFVVSLKTNLTNMIFGKIGTPDPAIEERKKEEYANVLDQWKQREEHDQGTALNKTKPQREQRPLTQTGEPKAIYQYTNTSGMIVMVNEIEKVPGKYRKNLKISSGTYGQQRTAIKVQNNQIWVPVTLEHRGITISTWLLLDTGATSTSISPAIAQRLGIQTAEATSGRAILADGRTIQTAHAVIDNVTVGPKAMHSMNIQIMPSERPEETGLLGMNFLQEYPHTIDTKAKVIRWQ